MRLDLSTARARYRLGRARIWLRLARYWQTSGDLDEAARHAHRALRLLHGSPVELAGEVTLTLAEIETDRCEYASGRARLVQLVDELDGLPAAGRAGRLLLARALTSLGDAHRRAGRYPQAFQTSRRACQLLEDPVAAQPDLLAAALTTLAITHKEVGEFEQAQQLYARVEQIRQEAGADDGQLADLHHNLAGLAYARQRYPQAERHARQAVSLRHAAGGDAARLAADRAVLAAALDQACGQPQRSEQLSRRALAIKHYLPGPDRPEVALIANNLGTLLHQQYRTAEAADLFRQALTIAEQSYPPGHPTTTGILRNLDAPG